MSQFEHLEAYDPKGQTAEFYLPIKGRPTLTMRSAGQSNPPYFNAISRQNAKTGQTRRLALGQLDTDTIEVNRQQDRELFPRHVITGWSKIVDKDSNPVAYTAEACREFLDALPDWIMDEIRNFACIPANFLPDDDPTPDEISDTAKN